MKHLGEEEEEEDRELKDDDRVEAGLGLESLETVAMVREGRQVVPERLRFRHAESW